MKAWLPSLTASEHPSLSVMAPELTAKIEAADVAVQLRSEARQQNRHFRDLGERKQFIDKLNGVRKSMYGELAKLPHQQAGLPADFADQFFRVDGTETQDESVQSVSEKIAVAKDELAALEGRLAALVAADEAAKLAEAQAAADEAALAAIELEMSEKAKQAAALKAKLKKK